MDEYPYAIRSGAVRFGIAAVNMAEFSVGYGTGGAYVVIPRFQQCSCMMYLSHRASVQWR